MPGNFGKIRYYDVKSPNHDSQHKKTSQKQQQPFSRKRAHRPRMHLQNF